MWMKQLLLMRHAKAERPEGVDDRDRALAPRGERSAAAMGRVLKRSEQVPDAIFTSPATRARRTAELVAERCRFGGAIEEHEAVYDASVEALLDVLRSTPDSVGRLLLVGHNPGLEGLIWTLCQAPPPGVPWAGARLATGALAQLELAADVWERVVLGCGQLVSLLPPRLALAIHPDL
jgi:phosphohistidine phosphatase